MESGLVDTMSYSFKRSNFSINIGSNILFKNRLYNNDDGVIHIIMFMPNTCIK